MSDTIIEVKIAHHQNPKKLGEMYNRCMETARDWVMFIDHDLFLLHPKWYDICLRAIDKIGKEGAFLTCLCNRIGMSKQKHIEYDGDDINEHTKIAFRLEKENRCFYLPVKSETPLSGQMILTHKEAWQRSGGFVEGRGICGTDNDYHRAIEKAGYGGYILKDLYCYHRYHRYWKNDE